MGGLQLFTATLLNPKAALFATALFPAVTWLHVGNYLRVQASFLTLVAGIGALWIALGAALLQGRWTWLAPQRFQRLAALAVIAISGWLLVQALRV